MNYLNRYNTKVKVYPDGNFKATYCNKCIFLDESQKNDVEDFELSLKPAEDENKSVKMYTFYADELETNGVTNFQEFLEYANNNKDKKKNNRNSTNDDNNLERSLKRAKEIIFDMAYVNDFKYFVTVTFDTQIVDSTNVKDVMKKMRSWLCNNKNRLGMEYILVPEYHKKGGIHCHLLITDYPMELLGHAKKHKKGGDIVYNNDGTPQLMYTSKGQPIYNMLGWKYGFSTCIPVYKAVNRSNIKLAYYITKYMTKDVHKIFGKFYWSSKGLKRKVDTQVCNSDYDSLPLKEYSIPNTNIRLKYDSQFDYVIGGKNNENE